jgi:hypothetical protein
VLQQQKAAREGGPNALQRHIWLVIHNGPESSDLLEVLSATYRSVSLLALSSGRIKN